MNIHEQADKRFPPTWAQGQDVNDLRREAFVAGGEWALQQARELANNQCTCDGETGHYCDLCRMLDFLEDMIVERE
jgi:hypothetical protein